MKIRLLSLRLRNGYFFSNPQCFVHDRNTASSNADFNIWTEEVKSPYDSKLRTRFKLISGIETQNQHFARYWRNFLIDAENNWSSLAPKFAFSLNTGVNYTNGTPYDIVFGTEPQIPVSINFGFYGNKDNFCCSEFSEVLPAHSHNGKKLKNQLMDNLHRPQLPQSF